MRRPKVQSFPTGPVSITGAATDNLSVGSVRLRITNSGGLFWNGTAFTAANTTVNATLATPNTTATNWSYNFIAPTSDTYSVTAAAVDSSLVVDASPAGPVGFLTTGSADTTVPGSGRGDSPLNNNSTNSGGR